MYYMLISNINYVTQLITNAGIWDSKVEGWELQSSDRYEGFFIIEVMACIPYSTY